MIIELKNNELKKYWYSNKIEFIRNPIKRIIIEIKNRISANYGQGQKKDVFTHDNFIMSKISNFLLMIIGSSIENTQKLYMTKPTCKENTTFLYISFFSLLFSPFI
jgi:hypothetical protein